MEDLGFFCVDNIPPKLIPTFLELIVNSKEKREKIAIVIDIRVGGSFKDFFPALDMVRERGFSYKILYIEAEDDVLVERYKLTRRKHPLADKYNGLVYDAIAQERKILQPVRQVADYIVDTSHLKDADCKKRVLALFLHGQEQAMKIYCTSFGFKHGLPRDSDLVFDVRCLPNPFYVDELRPLTGLDKPIRDYVMQFDQAKELDRKLKDLVDYLLPLYSAEGKSQLVISIGCSGGHHRSVVFAENMYQHLLNRGYPLNINHRDLTR